MRSFRLTPRGRAGHTGSVSVCTVGGGSRETSVYRRLQPIERHDSYIERHDSYIERHDSHIKRQRHP
jgi:hypothetical protein